MLWKDESTTTFLLDGFRILKNVGDRLTMSKEVTRAQDSISRSNPEDDAKQTKLDENKCLRDKNDGPPGVHEFPGLLE